eukprot:15051348-Ditylum_brightwellii.AAC.1
MAPKNVCTIDKGLPILLEVQGKFKKVHKFNSHHGRQCYPEAIICVDLSILAFVAFVAALQILLVLLMQQIVLAGTPHVTMGAVKLLPSPGLSVALHLLKDIRVVVLPAPFLSAVIASGCTRLLSSAIRSFYFEGLL